MNVFLVLCETAGETFVCPEVGGNGNYADPATCRRFYQVFETFNCINGYVYRVSCEVIYTH